MADEVTMTPDGYTEMGPGLAVKWLGFEHRPGRGEHQVLVVLAAGRRVEITVSPAGQRARVHVDGREVPA